MNLQELKNFTKDRGDLTDLVALSAFGRALKAEFDLQQVELPAWIGEQNKAITREIQSRVADAKAARVQTIRNTLHSLKSASERRAELEAELAALETAVTA